MYLVAVKALRAHLLADDAVNLGISGQVYSEIAPADAVFPYCVIALNAGGQVNLTQREHADMNLVIKAVGDDQTVVGLLAEAIRAALHEQDISSDDAHWAIQRCQQVATIHFLEPAGQVVYTHSGGIYRIRMDRN